MATRLVLLHRCVFYSVCINVASGQDRISIMTTPFQVQSSLRGALGVDGTIRGVAGNVSFAGKAKLAGADAFRTWALGDLDALMPLAEEHGLLVSAGIWLTHNSSKYEDCTDLESDEWWNDELSLIIAGVMAHKTSNALLWWTVGNEIEIEIDIEAGSECLWRRLEWVISKVKDADDNHPIGTAVAGVQQPKISNILAFCPSLDFLGVNEYGPKAWKVGLTLENMNWSKPYVLTEFGSKGPWQVEKTAWGAPVEPSSTEKSSDIRETYQACRGHSQCVGSFVFMWGWKWEKTGTWFSLFNGWKDVNTQCLDCESDIVAGIRGSWGAVADVVPEIIALKVDGALLSVNQFSIEEGHSVLLEVQAQHAEGEALTATWAVTRESKSTAIGGAFEAALPLVTGLWSDTTDSVASGLRVTLETAALVHSESYRVYVFVRDGRQEAHASIAFRLCHTAVFSDTCYTKVQDEMRSGSKRFPGLSNSSTFEEYQLALHHEGEASCSFPCGLQMCHTAIEGEDCYSHVLWAMEEGIYSTPEAYPGLTSSSDFAQFQAFFYRTDLFGCKSPCFFDNRTTATTTSTTTATTACPFLTQPGDDCYKAIERAKNTGIYLNDSWYPQVNANSSVGEFQTQLYYKGVQACPHPCLGSSTTLTESATSTTTTKTVCHFLAQPGDECFKAVTWAKYEGIYQNASWYPEVDSNSSFEEFQTQLYQNGVEACPHPCISSSTTTTTGCHFLAQPGDECFKAVEWAKYEGIYQNASWYPEVDPNSSFEEFQAQLYQIGVEACPHPCTSSTATTTVCPFLAQPGDECYKQIEWVKHTGIHQHASWYPEVDANSSDEEFQAQLYQNGVQACPHPCINSISTTPTNAATTSCCCLAATGTSCFAEVTWAMETGIHSHPHYYPGLDDQSTFVEFQQSLYDSGDSVCQAPCDGMAPVSAASTAFVALLVVVLLAVANSLNEYCFSDDAPY